MCIWVRVVVARESNVDNQVQMRAGMAEEVLRMVFGKGKQEFLTGIDVLPIQTELGPDRWTHGRAEGMVDKRQASCFVGIEIIDNMIK